MNKKSFLLLTFLLFQLFNIFCEKFSIKKIESDDLFDIYLTKHTKLYIRKEYLNHKEILEIAKKIEAGLTDVTEYLTPHYTKFDFSSNLLNYEIRKGTFPANYRNGIINLPFVKENESPYLREMVHALAGTGKKNWLTEGLALYLSEKFAKNGSYPNHGKDIDKMSKYYLSTKDAPELLKFDGSYLTPYSKNQNIKTPLLILCGSLVKYVESKYGKKLLLQLYNNYDIEGILNISFEELKKDWIDHLSSLQSD